MWLSKKIAVARAYTEIQKWYSTVTYDAPGGQSIDPCLRSCPCIVRVHNDTRTAGGIGLRSDFRTKRARNMLRKIQVTKDAKPASEDTNDESTKRHVLCITAGHTINSSRVGHTTTMEEDERSPKGSCIAEGVSSGRELMRLMD